MQDQNMAIVKSLVSVAWADGEFAEQEREMIEALISAFEATEAQAEELRQYAAEKKTFDDLPLGDLTADDRRVLLQHAVLMSFVDGQQADSEKQMVAELCKRLEIPQDEAASLVSAAEARAKRFLNLL
jgi:tellurite resistance protein